MTAIMKRFIVTTILTVVIAGVLAHFMPRDFEKYLPKVASDARVPIYCRETMLDAVDMGGGYKVECQASGFSYAVAKCRAIDGVCVSFCGRHEDVEELCKFFRLRISSEFQQDGLYVICGKSPKIRDGVRENGKIVNLQIAYSNGLIHVGSPLILGDY